MLASFNFRLPIKCMRRNAYNDDDVLGNRQLFRKVEPNRCWLDAQLHIPDDELLVVDFSIREGCFQEWRSLLREDERTCSLLS